MLFTVFLAALAVSGTNAKAADYFLLVRWAMSTGWSCLGKQNSTNHGEKLTPAKDVLDHDCALTQTCSACSAAQCMNCKPSSIGFNACHGPSATRWAAHCGIFDRWPQLQLRAGHGTQRCVSTSTACTTQAGERLRSASFVLVHACFLPSRSKAFHMASIACNVCEDLVRSSP